MIQFVCPQCGKRLRAAAEAAGKRAKCGGCGGVVMIPKSGPRPPSTKKVAEPKAGAAQQTPPRQSSPGSFTSHRTNATAGSKAAITGAPKRAAPQASPIDSLLEPQADHLDADDFAGLLEEASAQGRAQMVANVQAKLRSRVTAEEIRRAVPDKLPKRGVSLAYRLRLLFVAAAVATLPCLYVALVATAGIGVVYYITQVIPNLSIHPRSPRVWLVYMVLVATPAVAGIVLVVFMLKPLFFRTVSSSRSRSLTRKGEPRLYELVDAICGAVGAPQPARIDVDYRVNASASPVGGLISVASGKLVLTIGVPLIAGLSSRQLAGVLAHEFGHFSQKLGMGSSLMIMRVNQWFLRVIYERDSLDEALDDWIDDADWWIWLLLGVAKLGVMASRGILWCLMVIGYAVSASLSRQMEYDADRYAYGLVGSEAFEQTMRELPVIACTNSVALSQLGDLASKGKLADDMILLQEHVHRAIAQQGREEIDKLTDAAKQRWFDSHPVQSSRIARAQREAKPSIFKLDRPARDLVEHYEALCQNVTSDFYRDQFGKHIMPDQLTSTKQLLNQAAPAG